MLKIKEKLNKLPAVPGVYTFLDDKKKILYIGKATNLKNRVGSYFQGRDERGARIVSMVAQIKDIKIQKTDSALEALILESNLIKKFQPKYNVERKDDKSFSFVAITKEEFPRVLVLRETEIRKNDVIASEAKQSNKIKIRLPRLFEARNDKLIYGPYTSKKQLEIALKIIRKIFPYHSNKQKTEKGCLDFQIGLCPGPYADAISKGDYAKNIRGIRMILAGKKKNLIRKLETETRNFAEKNEFEKAAQLRDKIFALKHIQDVALMTSENFSLTPTLSRRKRGNKEEKFRIEAYDISNISGQYAVGSMVVFSGGEADKTQYRRFKIKTVEGINDVGMMAEVLFRRFRHTEWSQPDLILLDGGKGHLNMAEKVLKELNLEIPLVAVAKGPSRKISNFQFLTLPTGRQISKQFPMSKLFNEIRSTIDNKLFLSYIMSEAHRFAIGYHKKLRSRAFLD